MTLSLYTLTLSPVALSLPLSLGSSFNHRTTTTLRRPPTTDPSSRQQEGELWWSEPPRDGRKQPLEAAQNSPLSPFWFLTWEHVEMMSKLRYDHTIGKPMEKRSQPRKNQPKRRPDAPAIAGQSCHFAAAAVQLRPPPYRRPTAAPPPRSEASPRDECNKKKWRPLDFPRALTRGKKGGASLRSATTRSDRDDESGSATWRAAVQSRGIFIFPRYFDFLREILTSNSIF